MRNPSFELMDEGDGEGEGMRDERPVVARSRVGD